MNQSSLLIYDDQDSLFGSPPPSPGRGRSPSQEASVAGEEVGPVTVVPSVGVGRKNVGTIALPGSHMSCAELPADLPASRVSLSRPTSSTDLPSITPPTIIATSTLARTPLAASRSSTRSIPSRASSAASFTPSAPTSTRKRKTPKAKSLTPAPPAPSITLPGPNEPTPPNFLRSQSSLLGLAGVVGCVKPTQLHTLFPQPVQQSRSHTPARGSTPAHPIVIDDEMPPRLDQLDPAILRSNILSSLTKEKNIFPVLESLVKILGGESHVASRNPPEPFARPYGHGVFNMQSFDVASRYTCGGSPTTAIPPPKRRKLKHVPAGAADWDIPFPFATGEGPEAYRDTWARDRTKRLVVQLLELVRDATKRAAIKTAKSGEGRTKAQSRRSSRSTSVETQVEQVSSTETIIPESTSHTTIPPHSAVIETPSNAMSMDNLYHFLSSLGSPMDSEGVTEAVSSATASDHLGFEEWLSQLQSLLPLEADTSTPELSGGGTQLLASSDFSSASGLAPSIPAPTQHHASIVPQPIQDQAIDPTLLAISQQAVSLAQSQFATPPPGDIPQALQISTILPVLSHTPRTSFSSVTGPPTPPSDAFFDALASTTAHREHVDGRHVYEPVEKGESANGTPGAVLSPSPTELSELPRISAAEEGKARANVDVTSATPPMSSRSTTPGVVSTTSRGVLDKQVILERARARRRQLVAEIERAKHEIWETSIESAVLVHLTRDKPS
ncbi:hypothetical protein JVU11DRAFT_4453 [Chiua virens]|nr:hypothetical protein JVU11DRAFT_4453 [Chiua virens]